MFGRGGFSLVASKGRLGVMRQGEYDISAGKVVAMGRGDRASFSKEIVRWIA